MKIGVALCALFRGEFVRACRSGQRFQRGPRRQFGLAALGALLLVATSCSSEKDEEPKTFQGLYDSYLKSCADCHYEGSEAESNQVRDFDFSSADKAYASLTSRVNVQRDSSCLSLGLDYVVAGKPNQSYLLAVLDQSTNEGFSSATGSNCQPLDHTVGLGGPAANPSSGIISGLKTWISEGAKR